MTKPDKKNGYVLMNKSDYLEIMNDIISDLTKFKFSGKAKEVDNIDKMESKIIKFLKQLLFKIEISESLFNFIKPVGPVTPRLFRLPKTHKEKNLLRPILYMVNSAQRKLANFLNSSLGPVLKYFSAYCFKYSFTFVEKNKEIEAQNTFIASLMLKIFLVMYRWRTLLILVKINTLYKINKPTVSRKNFIKVLKLATSGVKFSFNSLIHSQQDGIAMGSPLGPTFANIFMGCIELKIVPAFKNNLLYLRYVDDCFVLVKSEKIMDEFFNGLNNAHEAINFTIEKEKNDELAFLDVLVKRKENRFLTSVYIKKTFTVCYLNF